MYECVFYLGHHFIEECIKFAEDVIQMQNWCNLPEFVCNWIHEQ